MEKESLTKKDFNHFLGANDPAKLITPELWKSWIKELSSNDLGAIEIRKIADDLGLSWPSQQNQSLSDYFHLDIGDIQKLDGFGKHKTRTLVLSVVWAFFRKCRGDADQTLREAKSLLPQSPSDRPRRSPVSRTRKPESVSLFQGMVLRKEILEGFRSLGIQDDDIKVMKLLYGLGGKRLGPEELSSDFRMSQEQVIRIRKKTVRKMRKPKFAMALKKNLELYDGDIWTSLANEDDIIYKTDGFEDARAKLPGEIIFAIDCIWTGLEEWLSGKARETSRAWYRSEYEEADVLDTIVEIGKLYKSLPVPIPLAVVSNKFDIDIKLLKQAVALSDCLKGYREYLTVIPITARATRAVRVHIILAEKGKDKIFPIRELVDTYKGIYTDDPCSIVDMELSLIQSPHLFIKTGDKCWSRVGSEVYPEDEKSSMEKEKTLKPDTETLNIFFQWSEERKKKTNIKLNARQLINEVLETKGICPFHEIVKAVEKMSENTYSSGNVHQAISAEEFIQLAPGIYGLWERDKDAASHIAAPDMLLSGLSCRAYVFYRYAGEPINSFPLWSRAMEMKWCRWAENKVPKRLFDSLMSVAEPGLWPGTEEEKAEWYWKKQCFGTYKLEAPKELPIFQTPPLLRLILAVGINLKHRDHLNWVIINRISGGTIFNSNSSSVLALFIGLGVLEPCLHWQRPHKIISNLDEVVSLLSEELHSHGSLEWEGMAGKVLRGRLKDSMEKVDLGWVKQEELKRLIEAL